MPGFTTVVTGQHEQESHGVHTTASPTKSSNASPVNKRTSGGGANIGNLLLHPPAKDNKDQHHQHRNSEFHNNLGGGNIASSPTKSSWAVSNILPRWLYSPRRKSESNSQVHSLEQLRSAIQAKNSNFSLDSFDLRETVGTGTFGRVRVVKLKNSKFRAPFALKIMKKSEVINLRQVEHIRSEKEILQTLQHPFIVNMFATFQDVKRLFLILEFVNGGELFALLRKAGRLPPDHVKFYVGEIALAFNYMHSVMVIYRDLKPENLLLDCQGHIKITDFGFAKHVEDLTWTLCGTPEYLAPEVIQSKGHGRAVDWWALGVLLFELLAGYPPFYDDNPMGIYQKVVAGKFSTPKHIDVKARDLIKRFLTTERTKRIGCLAGGFSDIREHKWFQKSWSWEALAAKQVPPPFTPAIKSNDDTSMFQSYPESTESSCPKIDKNDQKLFEGF